MTKVAVVTGSNKGIGLAIVRGLCKIFEGDVFLTARDESRGLAAVKSLEEEGLQPKFHLLDIDDHNSIVRFHNFLEENYNGLDVLVNNAAILYSVKDTVPLPIQAKKTINTNFFGNLDVSRVLFPLLRPHARVCNLSSLAASGGLNRISPEVRARFLNPDLNIEKLSAEMRKYITASQENKLVEKGFQCGSFQFYEISKLALSMLTILQQKELDAQGACDIVVNCCSPGFVLTDMTRGLGNRSPEEGADTAIYLCSLPPNVSSPRGEFVRDREIYDWINIASGEPPVI